MPLSKFVVGKKYRTGLATVKCLHVWKGGLVGRFQVVGRITPEGYSAGVELRAHWVLMLEVKSPRFWKEI